MLWRSEIRENETKSQLYSVGCIFKSFLTVLVGIAIYEGKVRSIEDCVIDYVPYDELEDINWYQLKIKHALSNTTGIIFPGAKESVPENIRGIMELPFAEEPGTSFLYKPDPQIVVYMLEEIYGISITEIFRNKLLSHFTNTEYEWDRDDIQGMKVSIQLLGEFGQLLLHHMGWGFGLEK